MKAKKPQNKQEPKEKVEAILKLLEDIYPKPKTALRFHSPFELLVATVLSAQSTDAQVNRVTEGLFKKYTSIRDFAERPLEELQKDVSSVNFYRNKARNIREAARIIVRDYGSEVPTSMEELIKLPGVARKTANIVLSGAFGITEGIAVDTHVKRLAGRLMLTSNTDPVKIERDLMAITPRQRWSDLSNLFILHGRNVCRARNPAHDRCVLYDICPSRDI